MMTPSRTHFIALAVLTLLWGLFFWRILTPNTGDRLIFAEGDFTVQFFANADYQVERIQNGQLVPQWNPYNYGGEPFAANLQVAAWYPPRWVAALLLGDASGWQVEDFQLEVAAHYWLAAVMTYAFLYLTLRRMIPALVGAVIFAFGGYLTAYPMLQVSILESAVWLPLMLTGVYLSLHYPRWRVGGVMLAAGAMAISFFAGHPQTTMQAVYLTVAYLAFAGWQGGSHWRGLLWRLVALGAVSAGLSAVQLIPSIEFTGLSFRVDQYNYADKSNGFTFAELAHILWPNRDGAWSPLYVGVAGLLLALGALLRPRRSPVVNFWGAVGLVGVLLALGRNSIVYDFFYVFVPGVSVFRLQEHMAFIVSFALAMLAAYQLVWWLDADEQDTRSFRWLAVGFLTVNTAALLVALLTDAAQTGTLLFVTLLAGLFVYWVFNTHRGWVAGALLVALLVVDLFTITTGTGNFVPDTPDNRVAAPAELDRLQVRDVSDIQWHVDGGAGVQAHGIYWRIPDIYGIGPIFSRAMEELRQIPVHRLWEVMAVRYATMIEEPPPEATLELLAYGQNMTGDEYQVFEVQNPRPFAHLVYATIHAQGDPAFARQFIADPNVDLREFGVVLEPLDLPGERPAMSEVSVFEMVTPEHVEMTVSTGTAALLTVAIPLYPGWQATVNGEAVEIVDVYAGLVGVPLAAGEAQQVVLRFRSQAVLLGGSISAVTLLLALAASVVGFLRGRSV